LDLIGRRLFYKYASPTGFAAFAPFARPIFEFAGFAGADYRVSVKKLISFGFITSLAAFLFLGVAVSSSSADQITLRNGDVLNGKVISMAANTLVLQDDSLGTLTLPRLKVANITFGTVAAAMPPGAMVLSFTNIVQASPKVAPQPQPNSPSAPDSELQAMAREIQNHSNMVQEITAQVLGSSASPAAVDKINELLDGLSSGQLDMNGLRSQVQSAADQLQEYKKQMGSDAGEEVDAYLAILNTFLQETASANTNAAP
jgi:hypothetical protein